MYFDDFLIQIRCLEEEKISCESKIQTLSDLLTSEKEKILSLESTLSM